MANIIRTAKSGSDWTRNELLAYNIRVELQDATTFFGVDQLPQPVTTPEEILVAADANAATSDEGYNLLRTLDLAMAMPPNEESAVDDFAVALLRACGYIRRGRVARTRKDINLFICGENRHAKTDVCILDDNEILLLVQEDKRHMDSSNPEAQLIAEAIAAFDSNNHTRERTLSLPPLQSKVTPGITMKGTAPTFYKIPVTTALVDAVGMGMYPQQETVVYAHIPNVPRPARRWSEGMKPLDNRRIILSCYEAFKQFVS
ncbi:hypothetical protein M422DRAFT_28800 [Sphaerobolus stellatus SS14]|nr:hypothetical protein M422DRAFT_164037 [Sphaerobolus stellatus SS14]KIJ47470.1 hypothetical protein M422DRAFT_28800 [Sphaerobolus stellatus SS14]